MIFHFWDLNRNYIYLINCLWRLTAMLIYCFLFLSGNIALRYLKRITHWIKQLPAQKLSQDAYKSEQVSNDILVYVLSSVGYHLKTWYNHVQLELSIQLYTVYNVATDWNPLRTMLYWHLQNIGYYILSLWLFVCIVHFMSVVVCVYWHISRLRDVNPQSSDVRSKNDSIKHFWNAVHPSAPPQTFRWPFNYLPNNPKTQANPEVHTPGMG